MKLKCAHSSGLMLQRVWYLCCDFLVGNWITYLFTILSVGVCACVCVRGMNELFMQVCLVNDPFQ